MQDNPTRPSHLPAVENEFDIGPLSWVKPEIQFALASADEGINQLNGKPDNHDLARSTLPHLHQVSGALRMVGLEPVAQVSLALEKLVEALSRGDIEATSEITNIIRNTIKALNRYLEGLVRGEPNRPLALYPAYHAVLAATGSESCSPTDLFFPNLSLSPHFPDNTDLRANTDLVALLALKRAEFQKGLLQILRGNDFQRGFAVMRSALAAIEVVQPAETRVLWWIAGGFLEGLMRSSAPPNAFHKKLCSRLDAEIKRLAECTDAVPEQLMRELLLAITYMQPVTSRLNEIHETYRLKNLLPPSVADSPESTRVRTLLHDMKEQLEQIKDTWLNFASGDQNSLNQFVTQTAQLNKFAQNFNNRYLQAIFANLAEVGDNLMANPRDPGEALAVETATELLTAKEALDNYHQLGPSFEKSAKVVLMRVAAALRGRPLPDNSAKRVADTTRMFQEKQLFAQVGQAIHTNLSRIEEILDAFFRDPKKRADLSLLPGYIKQVQGALIMLESEDAVSLLMVGRDLVQKFIAGQDPPDPHDTEITAEAFSNVGQFVSAIQEGRENPGEFLQSALRRLGITPGQPPLESTPVATESKLRVVAKN